MVFVQLFSSLPFGALSLPSGGQGKRDRKKKDKYWNIKVTTEEYMVIIIIY